MRACAVCSALPSASAASPPPTIRGIDSPRLAASMQHSSMLHSSPAHRRMGSMDSLIVGSERAGGVNGSPSLRRSSGSGSGALGGMFGPLPTSPWHQPMATAAASSSLGVAPSRGSPYSAHSFFAGHDAESLTLAASAAVPTAASMHPMHALQMTSAPSPSMLGGYHPLHSGMDFDPSPLSLSEMQRAGASLTPVRAISTAAAAETLPSPVIVSNVRSSSRKRNASLLARESEASAAAMENSDADEEEPTESPRAHAAVYPAAHQPPQSHPASRFHSARPSALAVAALPTASARLAAQADGPAESDDDQVKPIPSHSTSKLGRAAAATRRVASSLSDAGSANHSGDSDDDEEGAEEGDEFGSDQEQQSEASEVSSSDVSFPESGSRRKSRGKAGAKKASSRSKGARKQTTTKRAPKPAAAAKSISDKKKATSAAASAGDDASVSSSPDAADDAALDDPMGVGDCSQSPMACGRLAADGTRVFEEFIPFFGRVVELYTATLDPLQRVLVRASTLAARFSCATNKVGMYLSRRRLVSDGLFQAKSFSHKPAGRTGLKAGGYFLSHEVCLAFEAHYSKHSNKTDDKGAANGDKGRGRAGSSKRAASKRRGSSSAAAAGGDGSIPESQLSPLVGTDKAVAREAAAQGLTLSQVSPRLKISPTQRLEGPYSTGGWPVSAAIAPVEHVPAAAASASVTPKESASAQMRKRKLTSSVKKEKDDSGITVKLEPQDASQIAQLPRDTLIIVKQEPTDSEAKSQKKQRATASQSVIAHPTASLRVPLAYADSPPTLSQSRPPSSTSMGYRSSATTTAANSQVVTPRVLESRSPRAGVDPSMHPAHPSFSASAAAAAFFSSGSMDGSVMLMSDDPNAHDLYARARKPQTQVVPQPIQQLPAQALAQHMQQHYPQGYANQSAPYADYQRHQYQQQQQAHAISRHHGHTLAVPLHPASQQHSQQSSQQSSPNPLASLNLSSDSIRSLQAKVEQALRTLQAQQGLVPTSQTTSAASSVSDYTQQIASAPFDAPFVPSVSLVPPSSSSHPLQPPPPLLYGSPPGDVGPPNFFHAF